VAEHSEVLGEIRLLCPEDSHDLPGGFLSIAEELEDTDPSRMSQGLEELRLEHLKRFAH
jgi:hypothetical protein